jgi:anti-anti-sigma regulatory factor
LNESTLSFVHPRPGAVVVMLLAEHDLIDDTHYEALFHRLTATNDLVVVDFTNALFIDASFIRALFRASKHARTCGTSFRLQITRESSAWRALSLVGALDAIDVAATREEALREVPSTGDVTNVAM